MEETEMKKEATRTDDRMHGGVEMTEQRVERENQ